LVIQISLWESPGPNQDPDVDPYENILDPEHCTFANIRSTNNDDGFNPITLPGQETFRFYRALAVTGADFSMMASLFKKRSREELKLKFKKEERANPELVDKCLRSQGGAQYADLQDFAIEVSN
jgi:hypothetical protein